MAICVTMPIASAQTSPGVPDHVTALLFYDKGCCSSCSDVETYLKDTINTYYSKELQSGLISYQVASLKNDKALVDKYNVKDWALKLVVTRNGQETVVDVPEVWMYVGNRDAAIRSIKSAIDKQLGR